MTDEYGVGTEVVTLGLSIYQLGFAAGPLIFVSVPRCACNLDSG